MVETLEPGLILMSSSISLSNKSSPSSSDEEIIVSANSTRGAETKFSRLRISENVAFRIEIISFEDFILVLFYGGLFISFFQ